MPQASVVAAELRKLADSLDKEPETVIDRPNLYWYHWTDDSKDLFLTIAHLLPRPLKKEYTENDLKLVYESEGLRALTQIPRKAVCRVITPAQPAVYDCDPILSEAQFEEIQ